LKEGDIFGIHGLGARAFPKYGNSDNQNGIILSSVSAGTQGTDIPVFGHMYRPEDRLSTLSRMFTVVAKSALQRDIPMEDYMRAGGFVYYILDFDYSGLYATLAKSL
jgi:hypothetical protein